MAFRPFERDTLLQLTYTILPEEKEQVGVQRVNTLLSRRKDIHNDSILWIGSISGLLRFNVITHEFRRFFFDLGANLNNAVNSIRTIYQHPTGFLLLGTWGGGVVRFDPELQTFSQPAGLLKDRHHGLIDAIVPVDEKTLWITSAGGIQKLHLDSWTLGKYLENDYQSFLIYGCKYVDDQGRIYTWSQDIFTFFDPLLQQFTEHQLPPDLIPELGGDVKSIARDEKRNALWLAVYGGKGIYRYDEKERDWSVFEIPALEESGRIFPTSLHPLSNGKILLLTNQHRLHLFDPGSHKMESLDIWPDPRVSADVFLEHSDGSYWFSSRDHGLIRWTSTGKIRYVEELQDTLYPDHYISLSHLVEDRRGNVWINSITGFSVYDYARDTIYNYPWALQDTATIIDFVDVLEDANGRVWFLSDHHGLMEVSPDHPEAGIVQVIDLPWGNQLWSGAADQRGNLWLRSITGLSCFNPQTRSFRTFDKTYGLSDRAVSLNGLDDGRMYFGEPGAFQLFHPDSLLLNEQLPAPYLEGFAVFDRPLATEAPLHLLSQIDLAPQENFFSIRFSNINFTLPMQDSFAYQLEGVDPDWVYTQDRREVFYTNVPSGDYTFKLRSANNEGQWNPEILTFDLNIATPWWKTGWAILIYILLATYLLYALYRFHLSRQLAREEARRLQELDAFKSRFYANITHEFRTPITVILGMSETIQSTNEDRPKTLHAAEMIKRNGASLLKLVNELLELDKLRHGKMHLQFVQMDIVPYIKYVCESFQSLAKSQRIDFCVDSEIDTLVMDVDSEKIAIILSNLISNAIKFTPENGKVSVRFRLARELEKSFLYLEVKDTGIGLSTQEQEAVFERFYQVQSTEESTIGGTGIGLTLTKELVEQMGGRIGVDSQAGRGSTFWVQIPKTRKAPMLSKQIPVLRPKETEASGSPVTVLPKETSAELSSVLIIEDSADVAEYLQHCLVGQYSLLYAPDGKKGTELAVEHIPDIIISDVMMPEMDGFEVCERLKNDERTNHIPIILLTARATVTDKVTGIRQGADAYMIKPFAKEELLARLDQLLALRATLQLKYTTALSGHKPDEPLPADPVDAFIARAESITLEHMEDESFSGADLAAHLHLSPSQTYRKIKALTDMSTAVYIRHVRLQRAKELLADDSLTVSEIAFRTGFKTPAYFSQCFREVFGESPTAFRDRQGA
ncbi:ATP-binding protein [Flavilitoribacter nigricans]|uniref:histidine kinase n=1 Tax=Flavilitoribacter nigricans (strain ATCC 23147 / DSM 23189 / NBRC 102662 / NCIMB 1420 / SS-2) TaxID=1122177 RepID=A0A2D0NIB5_FLAN2|nr:ATP-binding protein [Flavilitoribacter nigricans]PHN07929.1 hypothetical protein CRP01_04015 [Flavilitoribacter nigricans DSM 23189 = NBRC 102662]